MLAWSRRTIAWSCLALVVGASCSVFPDEATLPSHAGAGSAGEGMGDDGGSSSGGRSDVVIPEAGAAGQPLDVGGTSGSAGSGGSGGVVPNGGAGGFAGEGGSGGEPPCGSPQSVRVQAAFDTWIGSAKPTNNHGSEKVLTVAAGNDEHRALIAFTLPQTLLGAELRRATLRLHLESNADVGLALRRLGVHQLMKDFEEGRATWNENAKNSNWSTKGGDFVAAALDSARIGAGTSSGNVDFNLTPGIAQLQGPAPIPLSLIVLEATAARPAPAELAFASTQGNASLLPELLLDYCDP